MSTRTAAARANVKKGDLRSVKKASPEIKATINEMAAAISRDDNSIDTNLLMNGLLEACGSEKFEQFKEEVLLWLEPDGLVEGFNRSWDYGWMGKLQTVSGYVGLAALIAGACEIAGDVADIPGLKVVTKLANWWLER